MTNPNNMHIEIAEKPDTQETPPESKVDKHSQGGIRAIQGTVEPQVAEAQTTALPQLDASEQRDTLNRASLKASEHVSEHNDTKAARRVEYYKLRGRIGEELAEENIPDSININDVTGKSNFANYDVVSPHEMSSVKVKELTDEGQPRYADYNKYFRDITNPNSKSNQRAAEDLRKLRQEEPDKWQELSKNLPNEVVQAQDSQQIAQTMSAQGSLRIPGDQVAVVRNDLMWRVMNDPMAYGLEPDAEDLETQVQQLTRVRVKSINKQCMLDNISQAAIDMQRQRPHRKE